MLLQMNKNTQAIFLQKGKILEDVNDLIHKIPYINGNQECTFGEKVGINTWEKIDNLKIRPNIISQISFE